MATNTTDMTLAEIVQEINLCTKNYNFSSHTIWAVTSNYSFVMQLQRGDNGEDYITLKLQSLSRHTGSDGKPKVKYGKSYTYGQYDLKEDIVNEIAALYEQIDPLPESERELILESWFKK